jgi:hypothetical protein
MPVGSFSIIAVVQLFKEDSSYAEAPRLEGV